MPTSAPESPSATSPAPESSAAPSPEADAGADTGADAGSDRAGRRGRHGRPAGRLTADQRRAEVLEAAVVEFAQSGYRGTRTADIAFRAGVSQPYVYALFPDKRSLFLACHQATTDRIREAIEKAGADYAGHDVEAALDRAYRNLLDAHPHHLLFQVQAHAAATADPVIAAPVRDRLIGLIELTERRYGVHRDVVMRHVARALLGNVALALDLPPEYRPTV
jgi:AcrR family transcriptional regulator